MPVTHKIRPCCSPGGVSCHPSHKDPGSAPCPREAGHPGFSLHLFFPVRDGIRDPWVLHGTGRLLWAHTCVWFCTWQLMNFLLQAKAIYANNMTWFQPRFRNDHFMMLFPKVFSLLGFLFTEVPLSNLCCSCDGSRNLFTNRYDTCSHIQLLSSLPVPPGQFFRQQMCPCHPLVYTLIRHALLSASAPAAAQGGAESQESTADPSSSDSSLKCPFFTCLHGLKQ